jgi:hypothetical protein
MAERAKTFLSRHRRHTGVVMEMQARSLCRARAHVDRHLFRRSALVSDRLA